MLRPGRLRTWWTVGAAVLVIFGVVFTATRVRLDYFDSELTLPGRRARGPRARARVARGPGGAALRAADRAQPQARARLALDPRRAGRPRDPARGPRRARGRGAASRWWSRAASRCSSTPGATTPTRRSSSRRRPAGRAWRRATSTPPMRAARRWPLAALLVAARSPCACGGSTTGCRTSSTPTRTRTSCRARSGCSATR